MTATPWADRPGRAIHLPNNIVLLSSSDTADEYWAIDVNLRHSPTRRTFSLSLRRRDCWRLAWWFLCRVVRP
ncbi:MAG: hypothetical protein AAFX81_16095 [Pseudomonadota bacterium]